MAKIFNVSGDCKPNLHYMVDITERLQEIKKLVDRGEYFTINRARQFGKTTTLRALKKYSQNDYRIVSLDFQKMGAASFENETTFSRIFTVYFGKTIRREFVHMPEEMKQALDKLEEAAQKSETPFTLFSLFMHLSHLCELSEKPVVLMIDEVDSASNNQVFLDFLAQLWAYYIDRDEGAAFHSVILAGVYDIKNLRMKIRSEDEHKMNSPWNIAADFNIDMSLSIVGIEGMLEKYEDDYHTGMDIRSMATLLYDYTSGYPFLVSRICKLLDEQVAGSDNYPQKKEAWSKSGFLTAVRILLTEKNTLFESLTGKLDEFPELDQMISDLLFTGKNIIYNPDNHAISVAAMFGFIKNRDGNVVIANRIFETRLYNRLLLAEELQRSSIYKASVQEKSRFITNGHLNMRMILEKFVEHFHELYADKNEKFLEDDGRKYFLLYLRPIINGIGNYYIESQTRDMKRTDVIIDYRGEQYIVEMKIWHGEEYNRRGEKQLVEYLDAYYLDKDYMLSFNFNQKKQIGVQEIVVGDKMLIEAVV